MEPLNNSIFIAKNINQKLVQQTEQLQKSNKQIKELHKDHENIKKNMRIMNSYIYSWYYWFTSIFTYETTEKENTIQDNIANVGKGEIIQKENNNCEYLKQLNELEELSISIGEQIDNQNQILDNVDDKTMRSLNLIKDNNKKIGKL